MADRLSDRISGSETDDGSDSDSDSEPVRPECWLIDDETDDDPSRIDQTRETTIEVHQLDGSDRPRRLVVKLEDGVYNLYLQVKRTEETDRGLVGRWKAKRLLSAGNAENPLL